MSAKLVTLRNNYSYVLLPENLIEPWYDAAALHAFQSVPIALSHSRCFILSLILVIIPFIILIGSLPASTTMLVQQIHAADHINYLSCNITYVLFTQRSIDKN